jgi:hypothetical protein
MIVKKLAVLSLLACAAASTSVLAQSQAAGSGPNPYVDCGIGAALFPQTHWAAVTSNVIWDIGTTAVTSATASPQTCNGKRVAAALFIRDTYAALAEETARGEGEHLTTALNLFECNGDRHAAAAQSARSAMAARVGSDSYAAQDSIEKAADLFSVMEASVAQSCSA